MPPWEVSVEKRPHGRRLGRTIALAAGALLALSGLRFLALLAFGTPANARIVYAVSGSGARNPVYRLGYEFDAGGGTHRGNATLAASARPLGLIRIRYLALWPGVNYYDSAGLLAAYGLVFLLPGAALLFTGLRRGPSRRLPG